MALTIYDNKEAGGARVKLDRRVYLTAAGKLVEEGHPEAATLYGSVGKQVSKADFEAHGGTIAKAPSNDGCPVEVVEVPDPVAAPKPKPKRKRKTKAKAKATPKRKTTKKGK